MFSSHLAVTIFVDPFYYKVLYLWLTGLHLPEKKILHLMFKMK